MSNYQHNIDIDTLKGDEVFVTTVSISTESCDNYLITSDGMLSDGDVDKWVDKLVETGYFGEDDRDLVYVEDIHYHIVGEGYFK